MSHKSMISLLLCLHLHVEKYILFLACKEVELKRDADGSCGIMVSNQFWKENDQICGVSYYHLPAALHSVRCVYVCACVHVFVHVCVHIILLIHYTY